MATPTNPPQAPTTFADQELRMVAIVLQARGWLITDQRNDGSKLVIIATRPLGPVELNLDRLRSEG